MTDWEDRLIDTMLEENVGEDLPPDLRGPIMRKIHCRSRHRIILTILTTAAAIAFLLFFAYQKPEEHIPVAPRLLTQQYRIEGDYQFIEKQIVTGDKSALLYMGQDEYIKVLIGSDSIVQVEENRLLLRRGFVDCEVEKNHGGFEVHTDVGTAEVLGTRFVVHVLEKENEMLGKRMMVKVLTGAVMVSAIFGNISNTINAGDVAIVANGQRMVVAEKKDEKAVTPQQIELKAIRALRGILEGRAARIREEMLQDDNIAALLASATKATNTYFAKLEANETYKQLQAEKKEIIANQRRNTNWGEMDEEARKTLWKEMRQSYHRQVEITRELTEIAETDEQLKPLRKAMLDAWLAYQKSFEEKLSQSKEYAALQARIIEIDTWQISLMPQNYSFGNPGNPGIPGIRGNRGNRQRGQGIAKPAGGATTNQPGRTPNQPAKETETF